jgi:hypothetical protein
MGEASRNHRKIASNIRELVVNPFARWCDQHASRVQNSQDDLQGRIKAHDRQAETVRQYRSQYYNKCRRVEDLDEEEKLAFQDPQVAALTDSPKPSILPVPSIKIEEDDDPEPIDIGDETYQPEQVKKILTHILNNVPLGETKVPILGTYQNVTTGAEITEYIQRHLGATSVAYAERIGQDMVTHGFLRLIGNVGNTFANSSKMKYQWRPKVFQITGIPEKKTNLLSRSSTIMSTGSDGSPVIGDKISEYMGQWNPLNNQYPNETPAEKLRREAREADERYKASVRKLDGLRCSLEEAMIEHMKFMERCELDRLKAIKSVILDFSGAISNVIPSLQSTVDNMMLFQETVQPLSDLRYLLENYRTGNFFPKVTTYENYYNNVDEQAFGVDIEARARSDRKRVPLIITTILTFLDSHYPDLEGDEARRSIWTVDVPLGATHHLRKELNTGKPISADLLEKYEVPIVASVLKLYLLELPDSLVSSHVYEIIKTIYTTTSQTSSEAARIQVIQSTLGQLRLANIATLDALVTHFTRLIELTSADETYINTLATVLAPCIMRPKQESSLSMTEKYNVRLMKDLFAHKDAIFGELKRQSSLTHTASGSTRQVRAVSTDESKRREHMEERNRAIAAATASSSSSSGGPQHMHTVSTPISQAKSVRQPSPSPGHRRDRSRGPETRFPVSATAAHQNSGRVMSPTQSSVSSSSQRDSLGVPLSPPSTRTHRQGEIDGVNGIAGLHQSPPRDQEEFSAGGGKSGTIAERTLTSAGSGEGTADAGFGGPLVNGSTDTTANTATTSAGGEGEGIAPATPTKKDSLTRSSGRGAGGATVGGLAKRSSGVVRKGLVGSTGGEGEVGKSSGEEETVVKGVQLEDKPMDFD